MQYYLSTICKFGQSCFLIILAVMLGCSGKANAIDGTVIAEFEWKGKHQITLEEMMQEISELPEYKQNQYSKSKEGLVEYMTLMAESRLILLMAKEQDLDQKGEIKRKVQEYLHELMVEKITDIEVEQKVKPTDDDFRTYYEENKKDYVSPDQVRVTCIAVSDQETATKALAEIHQEGRDITEIAKELSDKGQLEGPGSDPSNPGDTDFFSRESFSQVVKPFVDKAFEMEIGDINEKLVEVEVQGSKYYMIFRKEEFKKERQKPYEEVKDDVAYEAEEKLRADLTKSWLGKLKVQASVKMFGDRIELPKADEAEKIDPAGENTSSEVENVPSNEPAKE